MVPCANQYSGHTAARRGGGRGRGVSSVRRGGRRERGAAAARAAACAAPRARPPHVPPRAPARGSRAVGRERARREAQHHGHVKGEVRKAARRAALEAAAGDRVAHVGEAERRRRGEVEGAVLRRVGWAARVGGGAQHARRGRAREGVHAGGAAAHRRRRPRMPARRRGRACPGPPCAIGPDPLAAGAAPGRGSPSATKRLAPHPPTSLSAKPRSSTRWGADTGASMAATRGRTARRRASAGPRARWADRTPQGPARREESAMVLRWETADARGDVIWGAGGPRRPHGAGGGTAARARTLMRSALPHAGGPPRRARTLPQSGPAPGALSSLLPMPRVLQWQSHAAGRPGTRATSQSNTTVNPPCAPARRRAGRRASARMRRGEGGAGAWRGAGGPAGRCQRDGGLLPRPPGPPSPAPAPRHRRRFEDMERKAREEVELQASRRGGARRERTPLAPRCCCAEAAEAETAPQARCPPPRTHLSRLPPPAHAHTPAGQGRAGGAQGRACAHGRAHAPPRAAAAAGDKAHPAPRRAQPRRRASAAARRRRRRRRARERRRPPRRRRRRRPQPPRRRRAAPSGGASWSGSGASGARGCWT